MFKSQVWLDPEKIPAQAGFEPGPSSLEADALPLGQWSGLSEGKRKISIMRRTLLQVFWKCERHFKLRKRDVHPFETKTKGRHSSSLTFLSKHEKQTLSYVNTKFEGDRNTFFFFLQFILWEHPFFCPNTENYLGLRGWCPWNYLVFFIYFFFFAFPSYISGVHHFWVKFLRMWPLFNPTIKVVTFRLRGWCVLGVFLLPAFTCLGHERQDLLSPCDEMHVCTD